MSIPFAPATRHFAALFLIWKKAEKTTEYNAGWDAGLSIQPNLPSFQRKTAGRKIPPAAWLS
jgi:hypothetical protein